MSQRLRFGRLVVLAFLLSAALVGCDIFSGSEPDAKEVQVIEDPSSFDLRKIQKDSFTIDTAFIDEDLLRLTVSYEGGCEKHRFTLYSTGPIIETHPPATDAWLSHDARRDTCQRAVREELDFDLSPLKTEFDLNSTVLITLHTYEGDILTQPKYRP